MSDAAKDNAIPHSGAALLEAGVFPMSPGEYLVHDVIPERGDSLQVAAQKLGLTESTLDALIRGDVKITFPLASRLAAYSGGSSEFWLSLQAARDYANQTVSPQERHRYWRVSYDLG